LLAHRLGLISWQIRVIESENEELVGIVDALEGRQEVIVVGDIERMPRGVSYLHVGAEGSTFDYYARSAAPQGFNLYRLIAGIGLSAAPVSTLAVRLPHRLASSISMGRHARA
jgi:hypothetical protein